MSPCLFVQKSSSSSSVLHDLLAARIFSRARAGMRYPVRHQLYTLLRERNGSGTRGTERVREPLEVQGTRWSRPPEAPSDEGSRRQLNGQNITIFCFPPPSQSASPISSPRTLSLSSLSQKLAEELATARLSPRFMSRR